MTPFKFELGEELQCTVTGYKGVCVARSQYMTGCNRYSLIKRTLTKDGKPEEWQAFDEDFLKKVGNGIKPKDVKKEAKPRGGVYHDDLIHNRR